jgi:hypothetical protein
MIAPPRPPAHDELEALIKEARERQLRRRLLGAAGLAIAAALGLSVYAFATGAGHARTPTSSEGPAGVPLCRSSQLSASSNWNGAAGTLINFFTIANRSGSACSLPLLRPSATLWWHGSPLRVQESRPNNGFGLGPRSKPLHTLAPDGRAVLYMQWSNWCGRPQRGLIANITLRFPGGLGVTARDVPGQPPCLARTRPSLLVVSRVLAPN